MLIQNDGRGRRHGIRGPCVEDVQERQEGCGTRVQFHGVGGAIHRNESASQGWRLLESSQHIPGKGERQLLLWADAVRPYTHCGFVPVLASRRLPLDPRQGVTHRCEAVNLEIGIEQHRASIVQGLRCAGLHMSMLLLQLVKVSLVILTLFPFQNTDVLMGFAFRGVEQK
jgi:hypothetical protein